MTVCDVSVVALVMAMDGLDSLLLKCLWMRRRSSSVGSKGSWWSFSCDECSD